MTFIWIILLTAVLILEYFYTRYRLQGVSDAASMLTHNFSLRNAFLDLWYNSRELFLVFGSSYTAYLNSKLTKQDYIEKLKNAIEVKSYEAHTLVDEISLYSTSLPDSDENFMFNPSTRMYLYIPHTEETAYNTKDYTPYQAFVVVLFGASVGNRVLR